MTDNVVPLIEPYKIIRAAVINAQRVLAVHVERGGPDAQRTINELLRIFDNKQLLRALATPPGA